VTEDDDDQPQGEEIVHHAILTAQRHGKAQLHQMVEVIDGVVAQRCSSARASVAAGQGSAWDWVVWGRTTYVLEAALAFLKRLDDDPEAKDYLVKRFRREVIRNAEGRANTRKIPVDNSGD
jgi:hypothetical protein